MNKILVIEDDPEVRDVVVDILDAEGFHSFSAPNGKAGLELALEKQPHLIICDVMMPQMSGYEVLASLREHPDAVLIPFIFLTAKAEKSDIRHGMELGADDYLSKPFTRDELLTAVSTRLSRQAIAEEQSRQQLDDLRTNISFTLPHGLRSPLQAILKQSERLLHNQLVIQEPELFETANSIHSHTQTLSRIMQNFLLMTELELLESNSTQVAELQNQITNHSHVVIEESAFLKAQDYNRQSDLVFELQELPIRMSEFLLKKVIDELVDNAFKFSLPGNQVQVITKRGDTGVIIYVIDEGRGFLPGQADQLGAFTQFEHEFYDQEGIGLGLALTKRIVNLHGGKLSIESLPGSQTTVRIMIPQ